MKSRVRWCVVVFILSIQSIVFADLWKIIDERGTNTLDSTSTVLKTVQQKSLKSVYQKAQILELDEQEMRIQLSAAQAKAIKSSNTLDASIHLPLPLPDGTITQVELVPETVLAVSLADKFPKIKSYRVLANNRIFGGKVDMTPNGFHAMLNTLGGEVIFIDPADAKSNKYASYQKSDQRQSNYREFSCGVSNQEHYSNEILSNTLIHSSVSHDEPLKSLKVAARPQESLLIYRIAIATTGEYTAKHGGTVEGAISAITTTLSRVNQVLERDLGIHLDLVENNDLLINIDAASDPFTETELTKLVFQNQEYLDAVIGSENYDIGHLFSAGGGGIAAIASVCNGFRKAQGMSGISNPVSDSFDLDFVAHEIGHQLGATHTFNSSQGLCSGNTREAKTAFEPGSGSSIMSYAGYCGLDNLQSNTDAMYHIGSIQQIYDFTNSGKGNTCGVRNPVDNSPPVPDAGKNFTIPARTPFELMGNAMDADGDTLVYAWEQLDTGDSSTEYTDKGNNALFRIHSPSNNKYRSFPPLTDSLNHTTSKGEKLPEYQRSMRFAFVAQDGFNIAQSDEVTIQVERTGSRFALNLPRSQYTLGETYQIFWNVADTNTPPVNCQNVDISISTDGGFQFNQELAKNIANTGMAWITIPVNSEVSYQGRFKLKCSDNIFYALSYRDFVVTDKDIQVTNKYSDENQPELDLKDPNLDVIAVVNNAPNDNSGDVSDSAGGAFDFFFFLFSLLIFRQKRFMNKGTYIK